MESIKISRFNWDDESIYVENGIKDPDSTTVKLFAGYENYNTFVTRVVPKLNDGIEESQYTFIANFDEGIPLNGELILLISVKDYEKDELVEYVFTSIEKKSKSTCTITAFQEKHDDDEDIVCMLINDVSYNTPDKLKIHMVYDFINSTIEMLIVDTEFSIKKKLEKYPLGDRNLLFSIFNKCKKTITFSINDYPE